MSKKGGDSTVNQPAAQTPQEAKLQDIQNSYAEPTAKNALQLQQTAANMLFNSPGIVPVDYTSMGNTAAQGAYGLQNQTATLGSNIAGLSGLNTRTTATDNANLSALTSRNSNNQAVGNQGYNGINSMNAKNQANGNQGYSSLYGQNAVNQAQGNYGLSNMTNVNAYNQNAGNAGYSSLYGQSAANQNQGNNNLSNLSGINANNQAQGNQGYSALNGQNASNQGTANGLFGGMTSLNGQQMANNAQTMSPLVNGQLPSSYADNQSYAINRGLQTGMGNLLANNAARGVINGSAMNSGIQGLSDSLANTLSQNYNQNMTTAAAMQGQNASQQQQGYANQSANNTDLTNANQQGYSNNAASLANQNAFGQQGLTNQSNIYNDQNALNQQGYNNNSANLANQNQFGQQGLLNMNNIYNDQTALNQQGYANNSGNLSNQNQFNQQGYSNAADALNGQNTLNQQGFTNQAGLYDAQNNLGQQNFTNQQNVYNAQGNNLEQQRGLLSMPMELMNSAQNSSINIPGQLLTMANGQQANSNDLFTNLAQQRIASTPQTTYAPSNGGLLSGIASGLGSYAAIACFVAGTKISTPDGDKNIEDIAIGDKVTGLDGATETVTHVMNPIVSPDDYLAVERDSDGLVTTTTSTQEFMTDEGYVLAPQLAGKTCLTKNGDDVIMSVTPAEKELVYDFGTTGENVYFANGFAVRGSNQ